MRKVLHVGPCNTPGGMATVMHTLAEFPPEGWEAELLASHALGGLWAKWRAYRRARREPSDDAATLRFARMWCMFTRLQIGRGGEKRLIGVYL